MVVARSANGGSCQIEGCGFRAVMGCQVQGVGLVGFLGAVRVFWIQFRGGPPQGAEHREPSKAYAMLCYAMLCYAMLCYTILYHTILLD